MDYRIACHIPEYSNTSETSYQIVYSAQVHRLHFTSNARRRNKNFLKTTNNNSNTEQVHYQMSHVQCQDLK